METFDEIAASEAVGAALRKIVRRVEDRHHRCWGLAGSHAGAPPLSARLRGPWVELRAVAAKGAMNGHAVGSCAWEAIQCNARLPGLTKLMLAAGSDVIELGLELPVLEAEADLTARLKQACTDLSAAGRLLKSPRELATLQSTPGSLAEHAVPMAELCTAAGWSFNERAEGRIAVPLELREGFLQAIVERDGIVRTVVDLPTPENLEPESQAAIGVLLLSAAGVVRYARPAVIVHDGRAMARLQVQLGHDPSAAELHHALAALSVGARMCAAEVFALGNVQIARQHLAQRGCSSPLSGAS